MKMSRRDDAIGAESQRKERQSMVRDRLLKWMMTSVVAAQLILTATQSRPALAFTNRNLVYGSTGYDVDELQNRLEFLGYYHDKVDGNFSWDTYWAVRDFQYAFGLRPTGLVDMVTKLKLVRASKDWHSNGTQPVSNSSGSGTNSAPSSGSGGNSPSSSPGSTTAVASSAPVNGISASDQNLLAHVVYAEARGEPFVGQVAVAAVVLNRMHSPKFPHSIPAIVYQPEAFTSVQDGQINLQPDAQAFRAVRLAVQGDDPSDGATYYFNPATATSPWIWSKPEILKIGNHIFCRT